MSRFATLSKEDLHLFIDDKDAKSTKRATKSGLKVFHQYLKEKKADKPQTKDTLANVLRLFYAEARKADGTSYSKRTLSSLRFGLNRHFKATRGFDIINDSEFTDANKLFGAKCVDLKRQGLAKVEHKLPICEEDLKNRHTVCACVTAELFFGSYLLSTVAHNCHIKTKCSIAHSKLKSRSANSRVCFFVEGRGYFFECRGYIVEDPYFTKGKPNYQIILMYIMHIM